MKMLSRALALVAAFCLFVDIAPALATTATLMSTQNADNVVITGGTISGVNVISSSATVTGGTIDGTVIGGTTPAAITGTTVAGTIVSGTTTFGATLLGGGTNANNASLKAATVSNAVNEVIASGAATGSAPGVSAGGGSADANVNFSVAGNGTGIVLLGQALCSASGATPQTCNGQRGIVTTNSLSTAAATDASFVVNDSSVTASSLVQCTAQAYSGTLVTNGYPVIMTCVPGSGTITVHITNTHPSNALAGTVKIGFTVLN